ncbi:hypothetical protein Trydic_g10802 [Trypoxylus dichotomus]
MERSSFLIKDEAPTLIKVGEEIYKHRYLSKRERRMFRIILPQSPSSYSTEEGGTYKLRDINKASGRAREISGYFLRRVSFSSQQDPLEEKGYLNPDYPCIIYGGGRMKKALTQLRSYVRCNICANSGN